MQFDVFNVFRYFDSSFLLSVYEKTIHDCAGLEESSQLASAVAYSTNGKAVSSYFCTLEVDILSNRNHIHYH